MKSTWKRYCSVVHTCEKGQALLITILTMVVVLTVGLGVVSRSIVQLKTAKDEAQSQQAFSAAEAGIEQVLKTGSQVNGQPLGNNVSIGTVKINTVQNAMLLLNNGTQVLQDEGSDIWLSTNPTYANPWTGRFRVYWGTVAACSEAAIEVAVIAQQNPGPPPTYTTTHYAFDPCNARTSGANGNNFTQVPANSGGVINGKTLNYSMPIDVANGILARVIPLYYDTTIGIRGFTNAAQTTAQSLPPQGQVITSTGVAGSTQREISYFQGYEMMPSELFYTYFAP
jgi:Tfp pilus assembly protein PilX